MTTRVCIAALITIVVAGCSAKDTAPVVSMVEAEPVALPAECTDPDAPWLEVPDADVLRSEAVKRDDTNKGRYTRILHRRSVCRAAIKASKG
jgi:PBP1b-binding outer membrane lipoprotein LpoB